MKMTNRIRYVVLAAMLQAIAVAQTNDVVVKEVSVRGNAHISSDVILTAISNKAGAKFQREKVRNDEQAVRDLGVFKDVKILTRDISDTEIQLIIEVAENSFVKEVRITGNTVIKTADLQPLITQPVNQVFNTRTIGPTVDAITTLYRKKGYDCQVDVTPLVGSPETLDVKVYEQAIDQIKITGLRNTKERVLRKMIKTKPGRAFNLANWSADVRRIESTQWFEDFKTNVEPTAEINRFNLMLDVKEQRTGQIGFGASLDPQSRLAGLVRYTDSNFRGEGQNVSLVLQQDTVGSGLSASLDFSHPYMDSRDTSGLFRIYSRVQSYFTGSGLGSTNSPSDERFDERRTGAAVAFARPFGKVYSASIGTSIEKINTLRLGSKVTDFIQQDGKLLQFQLQVARDTRDAPLDPAEGSYARLLMEPSFTSINKVGGNVANNTDILGKHKFLRSTVEFKSFWSKRPKDEKKFADPRRILAFRARYTNIVGAVPFFEQSFIGGADSLRGYTDQRFWGKQSFLTSLEYRLPIQKAFNVIGFVDYGGAWGGYGTLNKFIQSDRVKLQLGYGVGIGVRTPMGLIRIDFGFNSKGGNRTHFSIGGGF